MRLLLGIVIGALLTISVAFLSDASVTEGQPKMVNWDVATLRMRSAGERISKGWSQLTGHRDSTTPQGSNGTT
jgi:hypothetical protein